MSELPFPDREERARRLLRKLSEHERLLEPTAGDSPSAAPPARGVDAVPAFTRYEIREKVGEGMTAVVYRAWDRELRRLVALKVLKEMLAMVDVARQRFRRESQTAAGLSHPNLVPVYDVGEENGRLFIVMEFVEGRPLSDVLQSSTLSRAERLAMIEGVARGVAAAHARGIVHRDLKPGNILVTASGVPKVADFGLAHLQDEAAKLTRTGSTLGTPLYMAPEQVRGRVHEITSRTDVYALGAMLYEVIAGKTPHEGDTILDLYHRILEEDPAPLRGPDASEDLDTIVRKALSKDPADRYSTAAEFAEDLRRLAAGEPIAARPETFAKRLWRKTARRRGAGLLFLAGCIALVAVPWYSRREPPSTAVVADTAGDVQLASETGATTVAKGHRLRRGQILRTGPSGSAVLEVDGGGRLSLGADTMLQPLPGARDGFFMTLGTASAEGPLTLRTPHGQADLVAGSARVDAFPASTWVDVTRGTARVKDLADGKSQEVPVGFFIAVGAGRGFLPQPAAEGLLGHWPLEDAAGNVVRDASGRGNDGVFLKPPSIQEGRKGKGAAFDGTNFLDVPGLSGEKFPASGTLAFWVKGDFTTQEFTELFDRYDRARPHLFIRGLRNPRGLQVVFQLNSYAFERVSPIAEGEWNHIAVTWDSAGKKGALYLNGALTYSAPILDPSWVPTGQFFRIGGMGYSATAFRGVVDDVRLYGAPLRAEAIRDLYGR